MKRNGFTLVEITIAMGLMTFVLMSLIGLMSVGLGSGKAAQIQTIEASALRMVQAQMRTNAPSAFSGGTYFFNYDGTTNATPNGAFLQCEVTTNQPTNAVSPANFVGVKLEISHPLSAPATNRTTNVFHASLSR